MQIGNRLYIDLEIPEVDKKNFLKPTDVYSLEIIETTGTTLPVVIMTFKTYDQDIKDSIIENNRIIVKLGESENKADSFMVTIYSKNKPSSSTGSDGGTGWVITFGGFINGNVFMFNNENATYTGNSLLVAKQIIKKFFGAESNQSAVNYYLSGSGFELSDEELAEETSETSGTRGELKTTITRTNENQVVWRCANQSGCNFLIDVLLHMDIMPSFPLFAFDKFGNFILKHFTEMCKTGPVYNFVAGTPSKINDIPFYNNFSVDDYKNSYNIYSGYDRVTEISNANAGSVSTSFTDNSPMLAASKAVEKSRTGSRVTTNKIQSENVHKTYNEAFTHNTSKLLELSSLSGTVELKGRYYRTLAPLDLVNLNAGDSKDSEALNGLWIIDAISTHANFSAGCIETSVALTRDNYNYLENHINDGEFKILQDLMKDITGAVSNFKITYAQLLRIMDGTYLEEVMAYMVSVKTNLLKSFSVLGVTLDFNSSSKLLQSLTLVGNSLMNTLVDMVFPDQISTILRDFVIRKPTLINLVSDYIAEYVPYDIRDIVSKLFHSLFTVTDSLNSIANDNGITVNTNIIATNMIEQGEAAKLATTDTANVNYIQDAQDRVSKIIEDFENNTTGLDIPFPIIDLDESKSVLPDDELRVYVANATILNLTDLGYLTTDEDKEELKEILLGEKQINFDLINRINKNAGNSYNYRFWGTFGADKGALYAWRFEDKVIYTKTDVVKEKTRLYNTDYSPYTKGEFKVVKSGQKFVIKYNENLTDRDTDLDIISNALTELTSFLIKKSYKDKYRTIPCTKMINTLGNKRIYFACPQTEDDLRFYINAKRVELQSFPMNLGYTNAYGNNIIYNVYYTSGGYNSSSVMFEVKKGGMV